VSPGADKQQRWPGTLDGVFIEEFDAAKRDSAGAVAPLFDVFTVQEIISPGDLSECSHNFRTAVT